VNLTLSKLSPWSASAANGNVIGRAVVLVPLSLALWWFLLKGASLWALRGLALLPLAMFVAPSGLTPIRDDPKTGEWLCNVEVNTVARNPQTGLSERVHSIQIAIRPSDVAIYASGWFSYLGLALSTAPLFWKQGKRVLAGLAIQTVINTLALAGYVYMIGYGTLINSPGSPDARIWWIKYFDHINSLVVPFAAPFLVAILMHPEWRERAGFPRPVETKSGSDAPKRRRENSPHRRPL